MRPDLIKRINELAKIDKEVGLNLEQKNEREKLRKEYLEIFREKFREELENITVVDEDNIEKN